MPTNALNGRKQPQLFLPKIKESQRISHKDNNFLLTPAKYTALKSEDRFFKEETGAARKKTSSMNIDIAAVKSPIAVNKTIDLRRRESIEQR